MKYLVKSIVLFLVYYSIFSGICGIIRVELLLSHVLENILNLTRLSSYVTLIASISMAVFYIISIVSLSYLFFVLILKSKPEYKVYSSAVKYYILFYSLSELVKLFIFIYAIRGIGDYTIDSVDDVENIYKNNNLLLMFYLTNLICVFLSIFSYSYVIIKKSENIAAIDGVIVGLFLVTLYLAFNSDFSTILNIIL